MVTLSNVAIYQSIKRGEIIYRVPDFADRIVETGALGLRAGKVLNPKSSLRYLVDELWTEGPGYPLDPFETAVIESEEIVGSNGIELEHSLNSSLARMGMTLQRISRIDSKPEKVEVTLRNGPTGVYLAKELPYVKLRPHKYDEEKYMSAEEILEAAKKPEITVWSDRQIDFRRYSLQGLIEAYEKGDPWKPERPLDLTEYLDKRKGCLNLPLNTRGVLKVGRPPYQKYDYAILNSDSRPLRQGGRDFVLQQFDDEGKLKISKGEYYLVNTSIVLGLNGVVAEMLETSDIPNLRMHSTSKFLDSGNINAPVCELVSEKTIRIGPKDTVPIKFEKVEGPIVEEGRDGKFSFQRFPRLPRWYDDSDLLSPLILSRHGLTGHPDERKIYQWLIYNLNPRLRSGRNDNWENYEIASRILDDLLLVSPREYKIRFLKEFIC